MCVGAGGGGRVARSIDGNVDFSFQYMTRRFFSVLTGYSNGNAHKTHVWSAGEKELDSRYKFAHHQQINGYQKMAVGKIAYKELYSSWR